MVVSELVEVTVHIIDLMENFIHKQNFVQKWHLLICLKTIISF